MIQTLKNIRRLNRIAVTLARYGFGSVVAQMRVVPVLSPVLGFFVRGARGGGLSAPARLRMVLEELGPTFVKLGQIASTRADLLPPDWVEEFKKLQDMVRPEPYDAVKRVVERSLGAPIDKFFSSFDETPVASASIAQVHYAVLADGTEVAVKVKRPGIDAVVEDDISVMYSVAGLLERYVPASRRYRPSEVVAEFERVIRGERDMTVEGMNAARFHAIFKDDPDIQIPRVYTKYTTPDVLTMERVSGTPIDERERLEAKGLDVKAVATRGIEIFFRQVFDHGFFHADLHPGNIFVRDDGAIIYLDFGIVGRLDGRLRKYLAQILFHIVRKDYKGLAAVHRDMGLIGHDVDIHDFEEALREITEPIFGKTLEEISVAALLLKLLDTARRYDMRLQPNLLLLQKSMVIIEGVGRQLYPDVNMWEVARPLIYKWMVKEKFAPKAVLGQAREKYGAIASAALDLPVNANTLLDRALGEKLRIGFVHHRLDPVADKIEAAGRSISIGLIVSAVVVASALVAVYAEKETARLMGLPLLSWLGFCLAALISLGLRSGPPRGGAADKER